MPRLPLSPPVFAALALSGLALGCSPSGDGTPVTPAVVDLAALVEAARPAAGEQGVLLNFWATW